MSDKTYWLNKHLKRQYAKSDFIRADGGQAPAWVSTVTIVAIAALIMGIMTYVSEKSTTWLIVCIVAGVATVGTFLFTKIKETTAYTEFILNYKDQEIMFQYIGKKHIVYGDIDRNNHMNNTRYVDMICDFLPDVENNAVRSFTINYLTESRLGEKLVIYHTANGENDYFYAVKEDGTHSVDVEMKLEEIK